MNLEKKLYTAGLIAATAAPANADFLFPDDVFNDFGDRRGLALNDGVLYSGGVTFDPGNLGAGPNGSFALGAGSTGMATDATTGAQYVNNGGGYQLVGQAGNFSNPISNVTGTAANNGLLMFVNALGDFAVRDTTNGNTSIYNGLLDAGIGGFSAELTDLGDLRLLFGNGTEVSQYGIGSGDLMSGFTLDLLDQRNIAGATAFGIQGMDFANGSLYTDTLAGTSRYDDYELIVVPAPGAFSLGAMGLGMVGLGMYCRRRK